MSLASSTFPARTYWIRYSTFLGEWQAKIGAVGAALGRPANLEAVDMTSSAQPGRRDGPSVAESPVALETFRPMYETGLQVGERPPHLAGDGRSHG